MQRTCGDAYIAYIIDDITDLWKHIIFIIFFHACTFVFVCDVVWCLSFLQGFKNHIKYDHNMWNYIYFYLHLRKMKACDHNAMEKYVYDQVLEYKKQQV